MIIKHTPGDPSLPHQIVVLRSRNPGSIDVSCNCLRLTSKGGHKIMGSAAAGEGVTALWEIYDNPELHTSHGEHPPFLSGDRGSTELKIVW